MHFFLAKVQHLVTKMKHKKMLLELTDPVAICAELKRHKARLERVQQELLKCKSTECAGTNTVPDVSGSVTVTSPEKGGHIS